MSDKSNKDTNAIEKEWTVMIYLAGDNNLSEDMIRIITELRDKIKSTGNTNFPNGFPGTKNLVNFVAQLDGEHPYVKTKYYDLTYTNRSQYPSKPDDVDEDPTSTSGSNSTGEIELNLEKFILRAISENPAKKYALILSGHSDAFLGRTMLLDENPSGVATLAGISNILENVDIPASNYSKGRKMDILAFDGCVMNTIEVLYELKDTVETCVGSQGSIPNFTWDYKCIGEKLMLQNAQTLTKDYIIATIKESAEDYNKDFAFGGRSMDLSAVDLADIDELSNKINTGSAFLALILYLFGPTTYIGSKLIQIFLQAHWNCQTAMQDQAVDIVDFCQRLRAECSKILYENYYQTGDVFPETDFIDEELPLKEFGKDKNNFAHDIITKISSQIAKTFKPDFSLREILSSILENIGDKLFLSFILKLIYSETISIEASVSRLVKSGIYVGADYQNVNGISIFFPWSYLAFNMSFKEYKELDFFKEHPAWGCFIYFFTIRTARPVQDINSFPPITALVTEFMKILKENKSEYVKNLAVSVSAKTKSFDQLGIIFVDLLNKIQISLVNILSGGISTKDNPPRSKGFDSYIYYFGKTNNIFPKLNIKGTFPPKTLPIEIED